MLSTKPEDLAYALDPDMWCREVLGFSPDPWQSSLLRSRARKNLMNCSRQSGKSTISAALALHESIYRDPSFVLIIAPSQDQSAELMLKFDDFRSAVEMPSDYLDTDTKLAVKFPNGNRVVARPGSEKTARSFSAVTLLLEDEGSRVLDDLYNSVRPMLAVSNGRHIIMSTPFGRRGHLWKIWNDERDLWEWYEIPAELCPRIPVSFLEEERCTNLWFEQEYHCKFLENANGVFTYDEVAAMLSNEVEPLDDLVVPRMVRFYIGLDLGQANDYSALSILEKLQQNGEVVYHLRRLERVRGEPYTSISQKILALMKSNALQRSVMLVIDSTGVGAPVVDIFRAVGLKRLVTIYIHGGNEVTHEGLNYRVPKRDLVSTVKVLLQNNRLFVSNGLKLGSLLQDELLNFNYKLNPLTAHDSYGIWREGMHDDLVLSVSLAAWYGEYGPKPLPRLYFHSQPKIAPPFRRFDPHFQ